MGKIQANKNNAIINMKKVQANIGGSIKNLKKAQANIGGVIKTIWTSFQGFVYAITGGSGNTLVKISPTGGNVWQYPAGSFIYDIKLDGISDAVYIYTSSYSDKKIIKVSVTGTKLWEVILPGANSYDISTDSEGNIYGIEWREVEWATYKPFLVKVTPNGVKSDISDMCFTVEGHTCDYVRALNKNKVIAVTRQTTDTVFLYNINTKSYNKYMLASSTASMVVESDGDGHFYIAAPYIAKITETGSPIWKKTGTDMQSTWSACINKDSIIINDIGKRLRKYDLQGNLKGIFEFPLVGTTEIHQVAVDKEGYIYYNYADKSNNIGKLIKAIDDISNGKCPTVWEFTNVYYATEIAASPCLIGNNPNAWN